jgi:hypothetical protein
MHRLISMFLALFYPVENAQEVYRVRAPKIQKPSGWYVQHKGYSGDCLIWWRKGRAGYTLDLDQAMVVSEEESKAICRSRPDEDIAWSKEFIDETTEGSAKTKA